MKHAWKICMLLGILIVCLLLPVSSIHEGFKSKKRRRREYKNKLNTMDCTAIQLEIDKYAHKPTYYKSIYAKREYETKGCKPNESNSTTGNSAATLENIQSQLNELSEQLSNSAVYEIPPGGGN